MEDEFLKQLMSKDRIISKQVHKIFNNIIDDELEHLNSVEEITLFLTELISCSKLYIEAARVGAKRQNNEELLKLIDGIIKIKQSIDTTTIIEGYNMLDKNI